MQVVSPAHVEEEPAGPQTDARWDVREEKAAAVPSNNEKQQGAFWAPGQEGEAESSVSGCWLGDACS